MEIIRVTDEDWQSILSCAERAVDQVVNVGTSNIRTAEDRLDRLNQDMLVSHVSAYAASVYLTGSADGFWQSRRMASKRPLMGDNGQDIDGVPGVDVKGSSVRNPSVISGYRLLVRGQERREFWKYVLGIVPVHTPRVCHLMGWAWDEEFPEETISGGSLDGAYAIPVRELHGMGELLSMGPWN